MPVFKSKLEEHAFLEELEYWQIDYKQDCNLVFIQMKQFCPLTLNGLPIHWCLIAVT
jgi:hypothetical protein